MSEEDLADLRARYEAAVAGGPARARAANALGRRLALGYLRDGAGQADRDAAIELLQEALTEPHDDATMTHVVCGVLLFLRAMHLSPGPDPTGAGAQSIAMGMFSGALRTPQVRADSNGARAHMQWVVDHEPPTAAPRQAAEAMLAGLRLIEGADLMSMLSSLRQLASMGSLLGPQVQALLDLLTAVGGAEPPARLVPALDAVLDQLPPGHKLRPVILAEVGALIARQPPGPDLRDALGSLSGVLPGILDELAADGGARGETVRTLAGLLVSGAAQAGDAAGAERAVRLARDLVAESGDPRDRFLLGMTLTLRGLLAGAPRDLSAAATELQAARSAMPAGDDLHAVIGGMLGTLLNDRSLLRGALADRDAGAAALAAALEEAAGADALVMRLAGLMSRTVRAVRRRDRAELDLVIEQLAEGLAGLGDDYPWRSRLDAGLGLAYLTRSTLAGAGPADLRNGLDRLRRADADLAVELSGIPAIRAAAAIADLLDGTAEAGSAVRTIEAAAADPRASAHDRAALELLAAHAADRDDAIERLERVRSGPIGAAPGHPLAAQLHARLADAHRAAGRTPDAVSSGLAALRAYGDDVLLQRGTGHALEVARRAEGLAREIAELAFAAQLPDAALEALELGRGVVLHSAMSGARMPALLRAAGQPELAAEWEATESGEAAAAGAGAGELFAGLLAVPSDLRTRVLAALPGAGPERYETPGRAEIAEAVRHAGADALVYLLAGAGERPGRLLIVTAAGELHPVEAPALRLDTPAVAAYLAAHDAAEDFDQSGTPGWRERLGAVCDWAWDVLIEPLPVVSSVILVPVGALGILPWHAASRDGRYACADIAFSYAASARHLRAVQRRGRADGPVTLVADPAGNLPGARSEVDLLQDLYPAAREAATPDDVLAALTGTPAPAVLHLACHAVTDGSPERSYLSLAGPAELPVARLLDETAGRRVDAPGGLVVLSACGTDLAAADYDEALTPATAFLATGATSVVGTLWPVNDHVTTIVMVMFHHFRSAGSPDDRAALRATQRWMLDPARQAPSLLEGFRSGSRRLADPAYWAAFVHHG